MRPVTYTIPAYPGSNIALTGVGPSTAGVPLTLAGVSGGVNDPFVLNFTRQFTLLCLTDQTGQKFSVHGAGSKDNEIYDTITGLASGFVSTKLHFSKVYSITPMIDSGNTVFTTAAATTSPWIQVDTTKGPVSVSLFAPPGSSPVSAGMELTCDTLEAKHQSYGSVFDIEHQDLVVLTPATPITLSAAGTATGTTAPYPATAVRLFQSGVLNSGSVSIKVNQGARRHDQ